MLSFKKHIQEVAEPKAGDEKRFKDKHVVAVTDYPGNDDDSKVQNMTKKSPAKKKRLADMDQVEAEKVYEEKMMKCEDCGEEYDADEGEHECDMNEEDDKMSDAQKKKREEIVMGMKRNQADLKRRYGDNWRSVMYATATRQAMDEAANLDEISTTKLSNYMRKSSADAGKPGASARRQDKRIGGQSMADNKIRKKEGKYSTAKVAASEETDLDEAFKVGAMKLKDGSSVKLAKEDVQALDNLYKNLNSSNRKKMQEKLEANKKSFGEILSFAKQAM